MRKGENLRKIFDEAEELAFEAGYSRFNMDEHAQRLRMSKKTIYQVFDSDRV